MKIVTIIILFCLVTLAQAETTTIVQSDGTVVTCVRNGTLIQCF